MEKLISLISYCRRFTFFQIFTIYLRYLIGGAFVIAAFGMGKFNNQELLISSPGVSIEKLEPIQQFFRVMATSGLYWNFIGWSQVIAGVLLMTQRFSKIGAVIFFGLILNIFIITLSYNFKGTPIVTGLMLLAATYLIVWDMNSFQFMFRKPTANNIYEGEPGIIDRSYWAIVGALMIVTIILCYIVGFNPLYQIAACFVLGLIALMTFFLAFNKRKAHVSA